MKLFMVTGEEYTLFQLGCHLSNTAYLTDRTKATQDFIGELQTPPPFYCVSAKNILPACLIRVLGSQDKSLRH